MKEVDGITINFQPASLYCFLLGYNLIKRKKTLRENASSKLP